MDVNEIGFQVCPEMVGRKIVGKETHIEIMAFGSGWYMLRYKGRMPFVKDKNQLQAFIDKFKQDKI